MATYLVTGGAGFIGSNICRELLAQGNTVKVLDNFATGRRENLEEIAGDIELFVDHDAVMANKLRFGHTLWTGAVPDGESDSFSSSFLSRIGQLSLLKEFEGVIGFEGGLAIDADQRVAAALVELYERLLTREVTA